MAPSAPSALKCESLRNPLGVDALGAMEPDKI